RRGRDEQKEEEKREKNGAHSGCSCLKRRCHRLYRRFPADLLYPPGSTTRESRQSEVAASAGRGAGSYFPTITSLALMMAVASSPALRPSSSTASLVIEAVMTAASPISMRTCAVVWPFWTSRTRPFRRLRALSFIALLPASSTPRGLLPAVVHRSHGMPGLSDLLQKEGRVRTDWLRAAVKGQSGRSSHRHSRPKARLSPLRHRLIRSQPYSDGSELDECEVVVGVFFVSRGDGAEVLEFVEEALDEVSVTIKKGTESRRVEASGHRFDARPGAAFLDRLTQSVGVVGAVSEQDVSLAQTVQHIERASAVMGLAGRELEGDGPPLGIDQGMDLGRQSTSRAPHASGVRLVPNGGFRPPFFAFAPCW